MAVESAQIVQGSVLPRQVTYERLYAVPSPGQFSTEDNQTRYVRGANFVVAVSEVRAGARLGRAAQPDEYFVFLLNAAADVEAGLERLKAEAGSLLIVPPGNSEIVAREAGLVVRVFSSEARDLLLKASNAAVYADGAPDVAPLEPWPEPPDGFKLRSYRPADHTRSDSNMRVFRSTNLMLNILARREVPRDTRKLSPHSHVDFEQGSLAVSGTYVHHCRYPWTSDLAAWREDEHVEMDSPSIMIVPPKVIHTSMNVGSQPGWLIDIFAPPRDDFSLRPGFVCNADEYPLPARLAG